MIGHHLKCINRIWLTIQGGGVGPNLNKESKQLRSFEGFSHKPQQLSKNTPLALAFQRFQC